jgi:hypothetical protein
MNNNKKRRTKLKILSRKKILIEDKNCYATRAIALYILNIDKCLFQG